MSSEKNVPIQGGYEMRKFVKKLKSKGGYTSKLIDSLSLKIIRILYAAINRLK